MTENGLSEVLKSRRWWTVKKPFPHIRAAGVFTDVFYAELEHQLNKILGRGLASSVDPSQFSKNFLTMHMADEFGYIGVRVNAVAPNSFPSAVSVESVSDAVVRFDQSSDAGRILVIDVEKEYYL